MKLMGCFVLIRPRGANYESLNGDLSNIHVDRVAANEGAFGPSGLCLPNLTHVLRLSYQDT